MDEKLWFMEARTGADSRAAFYANYDTGQARGAGDPPWRAEPGRPPGGKPSWFVLPGRAPDEAAARQEAVLYLQATGEPVPAGEVPTVDELMGMDDAAFNRWQLRAGQACAAIEFRDYQALPGERAWLFFGCTVDTDFPAAAL